MGDTPETTETMSSQPTESDVPLLASMRSDYRQANLREEDLLPDPIAQFQKWMGEAVEKAVVEPNAMTLATVGANGHPLVRTVLLKHLDERGFVFYTNLESRKARQIAENPRVSLLFPWISLERQVIITGTATRVSMAESLKYFLSRPHESQLGAWASQQSSVISSRKFLEMEWEQLKAKFAVGKVPLPSFWGGFRVEPLTIEFWQGGPSRLHDRLQYTRQDDQSWLIQRLAP